MKHEDSTQATITSLSICTPTTEATGGGKWYHECDAPRLFSLSSDASNVTMQVNVNIYITPTDTNYGDFRITLYTNYGDFRITLYTNYGDFRITLYTNYSDFRITLYTNYGDFRITLYTNYGDFRITLYTNYGDFRITLYAT